ncbi:MAG: cytochrome c oxidase assembly protein [Chloroflexota bacterium]
MDATLRDILSTWNLDPLLIVGIAVPALLYGAGFRQARHTMGRHPRVRWQTRHAWLFYGGLGTIALALVSPIDPLGLRVFWGHMLQHILLIMVAPPLLLLGLPLGPVLHAVPPEFRRPLVRSLAANRPLRGVSAWLIRPGGAFVIFNVVLWAWHIPAVYDGALTHPALHVLEHLTMLGIGVLFWWPIVEPTRVWTLASGLMRVAYPVVASIPGGFLGVWISEPGATPLYAYYLHTSHPWGLSPGDDQQIGGALMLWVDEAIVFVAGAFLFFRYMAAVERRQALDETLQARRAAGDPPAADE